MCRAYPLNNELRYLSPIRLQDASMTAQESSMAAKEGPGTPTPLFSYASLTIPIAPAGLMLYIYIYKISSEKTPCQSESIPVFISMIFDIPIL